MASGPPLNRLLLKQSKINFSHGAPKKLKISHSTDKMNEEARHQNCSVTDVPKDGNCMFSALALQLHALRHTLTLQSACDVRADIIKFMRISSEIRVRANIPGVLKGKTFDDYIEVMAKDREWGDEIVLSAAVELYNRKCLIIREDGSQYFIKKGSTGDGSESTSEQIGEPIRLGFNRAENHYVSLHLLHIDNNNSESMILLDRSHPCDIINVSESDNVNADEHVHHSESKHVVTAEDYEEHQSSLEISLTNTLPVCWSNSQYEHFKKENQWLLVRDSKLGCTVCAEVKQLVALTKTGVRSLLSQEWVNTAIHCYGDTIKKQQMSLRKKIHDHRVSTSHIEAQNILNTKKTEQLSSTLARNAQEASATTARVFRTAYYIAKHNRPYSDHPDLLDLQGANGIDVGRVLQSNVTCTEIIDCIAETMKERLLTQMKIEQAPFSILIDESTSLGRKTCMVVYIRCSINNEKPTTFFLALVEPISTNAKGIHESLIACLHAHGLNDQYIADNLMCMCTDGASVMMGKNAGVQTLIKNTFPRVLGWHCMNHRLELSVNDAIKSCTEINHFVIFIHKLYCIYSQSPKNTRELAKSALQLETQIMRIGRMLETRWVASSFKTVIAVWTSYRALHDHFQYAGTDADRDMKERASFSGLDKKLTSTAFVHNLGVMLDALEELKDLSEALQSRDITSSTANKLIKRQIDVFRGRKEVGGHYQMLASTAVSETSFLGVPLHESKVTEKLINSSQFYQALIDNMSKRLLQTCDEEWFDNITCLDPSSWPSILPPTYGEDALRILSEFFQMNFGTLRNEYRDFKENSTCVGEVLSKLIRSVNSVAVSTAECERGFGGMNDICTSTRTRLSTNHMSSLMFIKLVGPPVMFWNPQPYVDRWLVTKRSADYLACMSRKAQDQKKHDYEILWKTF